MIKMIPDEIECNNAGERKIYSLFKKSTIKEDWIVFHSFGLESCGGHPFGEIDFLVIAPNLGVFALEVKGGSVSRNDDGKWTISDSLGSYSYVTSQSPFDQAKNGMFEIKKVIEEKIPNLQCLFGFGVMFTDICFKSPDSQINQKIIYDKTNNDDVVTYIKQLYTYYKNLDSRFNNYHGISKADVKIIQQTLRPSFVKAVKLSTKIDELDKETIGLTERQFNIFYGLTNNPRCLIYGSAGTGKTILSIRKAKLSVMEGKRVGLFCYTNALADALANTFQDYKPLVVDSLYRYLGNLVNKHNLYDMSILKTKNDSEIDAFYKNDFLSYALKAIELENIKFDEIIIDEIQDIFTEEYLFVIDTLLNGGLEKGKWYFFGDFKSQRIFQTNLTFEYVYDTLTNLVGNITQYKLGGNCRNSSKIQKTLSETLGIESNLSLNNDKDKKYEDLDVDFVLNKAPYTEHPDYEMTQNYLKEEALILEDKIDKLLKEGVEKSDITILSAAKFQNSCVKYVTKYEIKQFSVENSNSLTYSTIHSFKGLDNKVIILTGVRSYSGTSLMYVGITRARQLLIIIESKHAREKRLRGEYRIKNN